MGMIKKPVVIMAHGKPPKKIEEFVGLAATGTKAVSIARMKSPAGWSEPGQTPEFDEYTVVLKGGLNVKTKGGVLHLKSGQAMISRAGEWVRYSTPKGAEYISVCLPAFSPEGVNRDE